MVFPNQRKGRKVSVRHLCSILERSKQAWPFLKDSTDRDQNKARTGFPIVFLNQKAYSVLLLESLCPVPRSNGLHAGCL